MCVCVRPYVCAPSDAFVSDPHTHFDYPKRLAFVPRSISIGSSHFCLPVRVCFRLLRTDYAECRRHNQKLIATLFIVDVAAPANEIVRGRRATNPFRRVQCNEFLMRVD